MKYTNLTKTIILAQVVMATLYLSGCDKKKVEEAPGIPEKKLIWSDEFDGTSLDLTKWTVYNQQRIKPNGPNAWWDPDNIAVENGNLVVKTSRRTDGIYASGAIHTQGKFENTYGYWEARVKLQTQEGHWGAFWLFTPGVNTTTGGRLGKDGTEIDIFEAPFIGRGDDRMQSALHYDGYGTEHRSTEQATYNMNLNDGKYHTFAVEWSPLWYKFYYDDVMVWETNFGGVSRVPQFIIISDEVGPWGGMIDITKANLPDYMYVDYVRVYNRR